CSSDLLHDDGGLAPGGARAAEVLGHGQPGTPELARDGPPQLRVVGLVLLGPGEDGRPGRLVVEHLADARAQVVLDLAVQQVAHLGRSFHATSLSTRISPGRPSTRSAMRLRRISEMPPSMDVPLARRYRYPGERRVKSTSDGRRMVQSS